MKFLLAVAAILAFCCFHQSESVISGHTISIQEAPFMVFIINIKDPSDGQGEECGGSIIKPSKNSEGQKVSRFILTAAHCVVDTSDTNANSPENFILTVGSASATPGKNGRMIFGVEKVHIHPDYEGPDTPHDIAILELSEENELVLDGKNMRAIKLAGTDEKFTVGTDVLSAGYGTNPNNTGGGLAQVMMKIKPIKRCAEENKNNPAVESQESLRKHQICALGNGPYYANVCKGDSGGPLYKKSNSVQIGVVSFGQSCTNRAGKHYKASVFTRITDNLDFIEESTSGSSDDD